MNFDVYLFFICMKLFSKFYLWELGIVVLVTSQNKNKKFFFLQNEQVYKQFPLHKNKQRKIK